MNALPAAEDGGAGKDGEDRHARRERAERERRVADEVVRVLQRDAPADADRGSQGRQGEQDGDGRRRPRRTSAMPSSPARLRVAHSPNQIQISTARTTTIGSTTSSGRISGPRRREDERGHEPRPARPGDPAREHVQDEGRVRVRDRLLHQQARVEHPGDRDRSDRRGERRQPPGVQARQ